MTHQEYLSIVGFIRKKKKEKRKKKKEKRKIKKKREDFIYVNH